MLSFGLRLSKFVQNSRSRDSPPLGRTPNCDPKGAADTNPSTEQRQIILQDLLPGLSLDFYNG